MCVRPRSNESHYVATHLREECAGGGGSHGFSRITPYPAFITAHCQCKWAQLKLSMPPERRQKGQQAPTHSCKSLIKQLCNVLKRLIPWMMNYPPLKRTFWFYLKARTLGLCWVIITAPWVSVGILSELALWMSAATPGEEEARERERVNCIKVSMTAVKYCWERSIKFWFHKKQWRVRVGSGCDKRDQRRKNKRYQKASGGISTSRRGVKNRRKQGWRIKKQTIFYTFLSSGSNSLSRPQLPL